MSLLTDERIAELAKRAEGMDSRYAEEIADGLLREAIKEAGERAAEIVEARAGIGPYAEAMGAYRILTSAADAIRKAAA